MMMLTKSPAARTALIYVTIGALTIIWSGIWLVYLLMNPPAGSGVFYVCAGFIISGTAVFLLGLGLGRLGRAARDAEISTVPVAPAAVVADAVVSDAGAAVGVAPSAPAQVVVPASPVPSSPVPAVANPQVGTV